ncbi:hypothetical protein M3Y99_00480100 [Aphelenchoides fujianensis]|nr:hypothetical protein M3Y99_00480100 [Aphelenchoides fujianensis]
MDADVADLRRRFLQKADEGKFFVCRECGVEQPNYTAAAAHKISHVDLRPRPACSICGTLCKSIGERNAHELRFHCLQRHPLDEWDESAIRLTREQLAKADNFGFLTAHVQHEAKPSAHQPTRAAAASLDEITKRMLAAWIPGSYYECTLCGLNCLNMYIRVQHEAFHRKGANWLCSVCTQRGYNQPHRNGHEQAIHQFFRPPHTRFWKDAVKIPWDQRQNLMNVRENFDQIQERATDPGRSPAPQPNEASTSAAPAALAAPVEAPKAPKAEVEFTILQSDEPRIFSPSPTPPEPPVRVREARRSPEPSVFFTPPPSTGRQPVDSPSGRADPTSSIPISSLVHPNGQPHESRPFVERIWAQFVEKSPAVLYFDHQEFHSTCEDLVLHRWLSDSNCKLLLVRSTLADWTREPAALERLLATSLPLDGGRSHLLVFAKRDAGRLLARFVRAAPHVRSFSAALEAVGRLVADDTRESALIVTHKREEVSLPPARLDALRHAVASASISFVF